MAVRLMHEYFRRTDLEMFLFRQTGFLEQGNDTVKVVFLESYQRKMMVTCRRRLHNIVSGDGEGSPFIACFVKPVPLP